MRKSICAAFLALFPAMAPGHALAWGGEGHRAIATLAYDHLTPAARHQVDSIIQAGQGGGSSRCYVASFTDAAVWPDCVRRDHGFSQLTPLHFEDRPVCERAAAAEDCPDGRCVTAAIENAERVLADRSADPVRRLQALAELEHFIGDLHQPLHMADNGDRGGNGIEVYLPGRYRPTSLHAVWDTDLVKDAIGARGQRLWAVEARISQNGRIWAAGDVSSWAAQSHELAVRVAYRNLPSRPPCGGAPQAPENLDDAYVAAAVPVVEDQLGRASIRLAAVLNRILR